MERVFERYDLMIRCAVLVVSILDSRLESSFNRFGSGVGKEYTVHAADLFDPVSCCNGGNVIKIVGSMQDLVDLRLQGVLIILVAVTEGENSDTGHEVQILLSLHIVEIHALTVIKDHLISVICVQQVVLRLLDHHLHCHCVLAHHSLLFFCRQFISVSEVRWNIVPTPLSVKNSSSILWGILPSRI